MRARVRFGVVASALLAMVLVSGCRHETTTSAPVSIRPDAPKTTLVGRHRVYHDKQLVGALKTFRFEDGSLRTFVRVVDLRDEALGYITQDGQAYRYTAHGGPNLVATHADLAKNTAAIFGMPFANFQLVDDVGN